MRPEERSLHSTWFVCTMTKEHIKVPSAITLKAQKGGNPLSAGPSSMPQEPFHDLNPGIRDFIFIAETRLH